MPGPGSARFRAAANINSKRLIYIGSNDVFRFVAANPFTCVQLVTFRGKNTDEPEETKEITGAKGMNKPFYPSPPKVTMWVQYFNCRNYRQGQKVKKT